MNKKLCFYIFAILLSCLSSQAMAYNKTLLEKDCQQIVELGKKVYKSSIKASRILSESLIQNGQPVNGLTINEMQSVKDELNKEDGEKVTLQLSDSMLQTLSDWKPQPYGISANDALAEKINQGNRKHRQQQDAQSLVADKAHEKLRTDRSLVAKAFPQLKQSEEKLATISTTRANPVKLQADSEKFRELCVNLSMQLIRSDASQPRKDFLEIINRPANKSNRWYFTGIIAIVSGHPEILSEAAVQELKNLLPIVSLESREAIRAMNFDFAASIQKNQNARKSFEKHANSVTEKFVRARQANKRSNKPAPKEKGGLETRYFSENWGHMWGDMADHLQGNFDQGTQYGQTAGAIIGVAYNVQGVYGSIAATNTMGANMTSVNLGHILGNQIHGHAMGELGMAPDPFSVVGHYAGGLIGAVGGSIGTAVGWLYGTVEAHLAQKGKPSRMAGKRSGSAPASNGEVIPLF